MQRMYIFLTLDISRVGGVQPYVASKADYLKNCDWTVKVLNSGSKGASTIYKGLKQYEDGTIPELAYPPFFFRPSTVSRTLRQMESYIGITSPCEVVIESHFDGAAEWGELLARRINAKHINVLTAEKFSQRQDFFREKIDFYDFKFRRGELGGAEGLAILFHGYRTITEEDYRPYLIDEEPIVDYYHEAVAAIELSDADYRICHIGRISKDYVSSALKGIHKFAADHMDKRIHIVFVGDISARRAEIMDFFGNMPNIKLTEMGALIPIPRMLLEKVDIVVASSGSARCVAYEKRLAAVMATNGLSNGLLGYETMESVFPDKKQWPLDEVLERALIRQSWKSIEFNYPKTGVAKCCEQNFEFIRTSAQEKEYYPEEKLLERPPSVSRLRIFKERMIIEHPVLAKQLIALKRRLMR